MSSGVLHDHQDGDDDDSGNRDDDEDDNKDEDNNHDEQAGKRKLWLTYSCNGGTDVTITQSTKHCRFYIFQCIFCIFFMAVVKISPKPTQPSIAGKIYFSASHHAWEAHLQTSATTLVAFD